MLSHEDLSAALKRLVAGTCTDADVPMISQALRAGIINLVTGEGAVALGRDATDAIITTGHNNIIIDFRGADAAAILQALASFLPFSTDQRSVRNWNYLINRVKDEVAVELEDWLINNELLNLLMEEQPKQLRPLQRIKAETRPNYQLSPTVSIIEVFDQIESLGGLLILGAQGAGKSTALRVLARELITRAENNGNEPIPVLFTLSSWTEDNQDISQWLEAQLDDTYGVPVEVSRPWLEKHQLLPLLDGLDELESIHQERCLEQINSFYRNHKYHLAVCCDLDEYERYVSKLCLSRAICLQPLTEAQIRDYLVLIERPGLWCSIEADPCLLEFVKSPLMLHFMASVYKDTSVEEWLMFNSDEERRQYLFNEYIQQMLENQDDEHLYYAEGKEPTSRQTKHWLVFLAKMLKEHSQTEFLIEKMQPTWLQTTRQRWIYRTGVSLSVGLIFGVVIGLIAGSTRDPDVGVLDGVLFGILGGILGLLSSLGEEIRPVETLKWSGIKESWSKLIEELKSLRGLSEWFMYSLISQLGISKRTDSSQEYVSRFLEPLLRLLEPMKVTVIEWTHKLVSGLIGALIRGLSCGLSGPDIDIKRRKKPNQGIRKSARNSVILAVIFSLMGALIALLIDWPQEWLPWQSVGLMSALVGGYVPGIPYMQHYMLRFILWWNGFIPWNYARFLNYACQNQKKFLQRIGVRYRFIHNLLQEHFVTLEPNELDKSMCSTRNIL